MAAISMCLSGKASKTENGLLVADLIVSMWFVMTHLGRL